MGIKEQIEHWAELVKKESTEEDSVISEEELSYIHEEEDEDLIIGTFIVNENTLKEGAKIGQFGISKTYTVAIRQNEGMHPHFHVYDKEGKSRKERSKDRKGFHTCVKIRTNRYFKHGAYQDSFDRKTCEALDDFMRTVRTSKKHSLGIGVTNYEFTIKAWNDQNETTGKPNWVNPNTPQPNYKIIAD